MRYIVPDTNCLIQALPSRSQYHKVWTDVMRGDISLCVNTDILEEYEEKLAEKTTPEIAFNVIQAIVNLPTTTFQEAYMHFELLQADYDDNKFVDCAIASDAEYIVSNDKHFNPLKDIPWPKVEVLKLDDFVKMI